jgi:DNA-binding GntR family transcriptional regulator
MTRSPDISIERRVLSETIKERILERIVEGRLPAGARIVETQVAREFGTSQAPVREAMRALATLDVVVIKPHQGARVRAPSRKELIDAIHVRTELEALGARAAAVEATPADIEELRQQLEEMLDPANRGDPHVHAIKNAKFHVTIMGAARNEALLRAWQVLEPFLRTYITATLPGVDLEWLARRHEGLLSAIEARDPDLAEKRMREHLMEVEETTEAATREDEADHSGTTVER